MKEMSPMKVVIDSWIRENVRALKPYESARDLVQEGLLLDANENPYPHWQAGVQVNRYPDPNQRQLRQALARYTGLGYENVLAGSGSDEVLDWVFKVFCQPDVDRVAIAEPTYGMYQVMADIYGVGVWRVYLDSSFHLDAEAFLRDVPDDVKLLFLCSPNNPTGNLLDRKGILSLLAEWRKPVLIDEAYVEFADEPSLACELENHPNLIILRTFSKAFGCAGLRLGYALASPDIVECFAKVKAPYNLSVFTQREGLRVLRSRKEAAEEVEQILKQRTVLAAGLSRMAGVGKVYESQANFLLFTCKGAPEVCRDLLKRGVVVRDRSSLPGLPECIRVTVGKPEENARLLEELQECLGGE
jgi:histidinol-phosphate aminotransferase